MEKKTFSVDIGGKPLTAEFLDLADQAHGSVLLRYGDTAVLATAVMGEERKEGMNYFPLSVEYEEKFYAAGAILGSQFVRREGRPSDEAVLSGRVVDRTIRPLFDHTIRNEVQVVVTILSIDEDDPDVLAVTGASLALATSDIPWAGPVSAVRIGKKAGEESFVINPTYEERKEGVLSMDLLACGRDGNINMIEIGAEEETEAVLVDALNEATKTLDALQAFQEDIVSNIGKEKRNVETTEVSDEIQKHFETNTKEKLLSAVFDNGPGEKATSALEKEWLGQLAEELPDESPSLARHYFDKQVDLLIHEEALNSNRRPDGRGFDEVRPLFAQAGGVSSILHGSGIFYRGGTHIFSALTLGGPRDSQTIDTMEEQGSKRFIHHYNFPPFSVGETGRVGGFNRRMIGHGALAEKALGPVIPAKDTFPYTVRIVSEAMASNGSSSMGSVCASVLALMDGGVPIKAPVAGIAMGLMMRSEKEYKILTDIQGPEDHHGDMDFKVAGTRDGVTAVQMDVKVSGIPTKILAEAFIEAKRAREQILDVIEAEIASPRDTISPKAPEIRVLTVKEEQIGSIIGPGGKTINGIKEKTGVEEIQIEDDGSVFITGKNGSAKEAEQLILDMTREYVAGERHTGVVSRIMNFGAFVKINETTEGLVHISEISPSRIEKVEDVLSVGDTVPVVIKEIDEQKRINLSIKAIDPGFAKKKTEKEKLQ